MKNWWLYILRLEQGKWYVGITSKTPEIRLKEHKNGYTGARWTRRYKPIEIHDTKNLGEVTLEKAQEYEGRVTRKYMEEYGDNNVRGGDLTDDEEYIRRFGRFFTTDDWGVITLLVFSILVNLIFIYQLYIK